MRNKGDAPTAGRTIRQGIRMDAGSITHYTTRFVAGAAFLLSQALFLSPAIQALADSPEWEPETVYMQIVSADDLTAEPIPAPASGITVPVDEKDVEILAKLLWSSPLTNEDEKRQLCWLVFNRVDDESSLFGATVESVVIKREFTFYDSRAHLSETNLRIAMEELRRWNLYLLGAVKERLLDADYLYAAFSGHHVEFKKSK